MPPASASSYRRRPESAASQCTMQQYSASSGNKIPSPQNLPHPLLYPAVGTPIPHPSFVCLLVICLVTLCWKLPRARPMQGVSTHVTNPNKRTTCTTVLENIPETLGMAPYHPRILASRDQLFCAFQRSPTIVGQSSSDAVKI